MLRGIPGSNDLRGIKTTLKDLGVDFDVWFSEESLHRWGSVGVALRQLEESGHLVEKEGALFFKAEEGTDDKDRVVRKSDGTWAYFASDVAYFADKISRGYDRLLITLGADHHGYVARIRNSLSALGLPSERFERFPLSARLSLPRRPAGEVQQAAGEHRHHRRGGGRDRRGGRQEGGRARRAPLLLPVAERNSNVDFDIDLAKKASLENPVFYVQYGHARLKSILRKAEEIGIPVTTDLTRDEWRALALPDELALAQRLADFPIVLAEAAIPASRTRSSSTFRISPTRSRAT